MKHLLTAFLSFFALVAMANDKVEVEQIEESVEVPAATDYVIKGTEPFATMGSVNITDLDHSVVILKDVKPSVTISKWLKNHVFINGKQATNGTNCQVRMFNRGAIIFPYASTGFYPLTCYSEKGFEGTKYTNFSEGHSNGFMKSITGTQNNRIKSFKLKRGYMVTFAVGTAGWGYSRCFIADQEDLEIDVPHPLCGKITSYRLFKWYNARKAGIADSNDKSAISALGASWCYRMWPDPQGLDYQPDCEYIPHHYKEGYPGISDLGSKNFSCHLKNNNEPGNSADEAPCSVDDVLKAWPDLMRTGMRLLSESSHDGSMGHLKEFFQKIDERGWRCDIVDLHCYWDTGTFNSLDWYSTNYSNGRPIWISEWVWGASWNKNGAFASGRQSDDATYNGTVPILNVINNTPRVERYAYWNSETGYTKIYRDGKLTKLGEYYANMDEGMGYNAKYDYAPKVVFSEPGSLNGTFSPATSKATLKWSDPNGDMIDSIVVERMGPNSSTYSKVANVTVKDKASSSDLVYSTTVVCNEDGVHKIRVREYYSANGTSRSFFTSDIYQVSISKAKNVGLLQHGNIKLPNTEFVTANLEAQKKAPVVVMGMISNANTSNGLTHSIQSVSTSSFKYCLKPWTLTSPVNVRVLENVDYLALPTDTVMHINDDMMIISQALEATVNKEADVTFPEAFPEGVVPVVVAQNISSSTSVNPTVIKVHNVTNTGFKITLQYQEGASNTASPVAQNITYIAGTPGQVSIGGGKLLTIGRNENDLVGGTSAVEVPLVNKEGSMMYFIQPTIIAASQTLNFPGTTVFRQASKVSEDFTVGEETFNGVCKLKIKRTVDPSYTGDKTSTAQNIANSGDVVGWFIVSDDPEGNADDDPVITALNGIKNAMPLLYTVSDGMISSADKRVKVYNMAGQQMSTNKRLASGTYVVTNGKESKKVVVK